MQLTVRILGSVAQLVGDIPLWLEDELRGTFAWQSIEDLNDVRYFYYNGVMYRGIVDEVCALLKQRGVDYRVEDASRVPPEHNWRFQGKYRPMQEDAVNKLYDAGYGILKASPGSGKTVMMAALICRFGLRSAILVQAKEPFEQAYKTLQNMTDIPHVGKLGDGVCELGDVTVVMVQTLAQELTSNPKGAVARWWSGVRVLCVDECQHGVADSYLLAYNEIGLLRHKISVSATPHRDDERMAWMQPVLGKVVAEITYAEQIDAGNLCPVTIYVQKVPPKSFGYVGPNGSIARSQRQAARHYREVYDDYVINGSTGRNKMLYAFAKECLDKGKTLAIIVSRVDHAEVLQDEIPWAVVLTAKTNPKVRRDTIDKLQHREVMCVITTLFDEATDVPSLDAVAIAAGGRSTVKIEQRIRSTRAFSGHLRSGFYSKERGYVFYPQDQADFLKSQSSKMTKILESVYSQHPERNEYIEVC